MSQHRSMHSGSHSIFLSHEFPSQLWLGYKTYSTYFRGKNHFTLHMYFTHKSACRNYIFTLAETQSRNTNFTGTRKMNTTSSKYSIFVNFFFRMDSFVVGIFPMCECIVIFPASRSRMLQLPVIWENSNHCN